MLLFQKTEWRVSLVSRILWGAALPGCATTIIPLAQASRPGSSDLPEGSSSGAAFAALKGASPLFAS